MLLALMKDDKFEFKQRQRLAKEDMKQTVEVVLESGERERGSSKG